MIKKNIRINLRNKEENRSYRSKVKNLTKHFLRSIRIYDYGNINEARGTQYVYLRHAIKMINEVNSAIDKSVKKNVFARNNGSRKKSRLAKILYKRRKELTKEMKTV